MDIAEDLFVSAMVGGDEHYGHILVNQGDGAVFHFGGGIAFSMDVGDFLQLQGTFEGDRIVLQTTEIQHVTHILVFLRDVLHMAAMVEGPLDFFGDAVESRS